MRRGEADHLVGLGQAAEGVGGGHRNRQDDPRGAELPGDPAGDPGRGSGGDPVVDDHGDAPGEVLPGPALPEPDHPVLQHGAFVVLDSLQLRVADPGMGQHAFFQHAGAALPDGAHGKLGLVGKSQLPHHDHVQRRVEGGGDFEGDRDAAAGQAQDHDVLAPQFREPPSQLPAGVDPVFENAHRYGFPIEMSAVASIQACAPQAGKLTSWPLPPTICQEPSGM